MSSNPLICVVVAPFVPSIGGPESAKRSLQLISSKLFHILINMRIVGMQVAAAKSVATLEVKKLGAGIT